MLAVFGPVGKTHRPGALLRDVADRETTVQLEPAVLKRLADMTDLLGFDVHIQTDYGDELAGLTPWELLDEDDALEALQIADQCVELATRIVTTAEDEQQQPET